MMLCRSSRYIWCRCTSSLLFVLNQLKQPLLAHGLGKGSTLLEATHKTTRLQSSQETLDERLQKQSGLFLKEGFLCFCLRYWILVHQQHVEIPSGGGWVKGIFHSEIDSFCGQHGNLGMGYNNIINLKTKISMDIVLISPPSGFHEQRDPELTRQITFSQHFYEQPNAAQVLLHFFCHKVRPNPDVCPLSRIISRQEIWRMIISFIDVPVSNTGCMKCLWHVNLIIWTKFKKKHNRVHGSGIRFQRLSACVT